MKKENSSKILLALSMAVFGTLAPFVRNIGVASSEIALYRAILAILLIGAFLLIKKEKLAFKEAKKEIPLLFLSGVAMGFNWILLFEAYKYTTVSTATLSYYFAPVIVTALCPLLFKEKLSLKQVICFVFSTVGIILITVTGSLGGGSNDLTGILFGLGAACLYATVVLINKFIKNVTGIHRTFMQFVSAAAVLLPYVLITEGVNVGGLDLKGVVCLLIVGFVHTGVCYCMYFGALSNVKGQTAAILSYFDPLVAVIISVVLLKEPINLWQIIGGALILGFTLLNEIQFKGERK